MLNLEEKKEAEIKNMVAILKQIDLPDILLLTRDHCAGSSERYFDRIESTVLLSALCCSFVECTRRTHPIWICL